MSMRSDRAEVAGLRAKLKREQEAKETKGRDAFKDAQELMLNGRYLSSDERSYARVALSLAHGDGYEAPGLTDPWHWAPGALWP